MSSNLPDESALPADLREELARVAPRLGAVAAPLHYFRTVESTNDVAAGLGAAGAPDGTTVIADGQTAGRGRRGRSWYSPSGAGLYVSIVIRLDTDVDLQAGPSAATPTSLLTLMAGVALCEGIGRGTGLRAAIKWPNDLLVERRKVAGILAEAWGAPPSVPFIVLGYGINVTVAAYPRELAERATSIEAELGRPVDRGLVLAETLAAIAARRADLLAGRFDAILDRWRSLAPSSRGALVEWLTPDGPVRGTTDGVDDRGALIVRVGSRVERLIAGEVIWL